MENPTVQPLPTPRLRVTRHGTNPQFEDAAARLRTLLSRVPNDSGSAPSLRERAPVPPSEVESDFDPPQFSPQTPSIAQESLKDLFSRALRDPGDTPPTSTPALHHGLTAGTRSPPVGVQNKLSRTGSSLSLRSLDEALSSKTSSTGSRANYHDRINDLDSEANVEREREWNRPHPRRSPSSLSLHSPTGRSRTHSDSIHPNVLDSHVSLHRPLHRRNNSFSSSRTSSPASSLLSHESVQEQEEVREIDHGRERNWNAPHPKWDFKVHSASSSNLHSHSHSHSHSHTRVRAESLHTPSTKGSLVLHSSPQKPSEQRAGQSLIKSPRTSVSPKISGKDKSPRFHRTTGLPPKSKSPLLPLPSDSNEHNSSKKSPTSGSRFGRPFPRSRTPLPPLELDDTNCETPSATPNTPPPPSPIESNENNGSKKSLVLSSRFGTQSPRSRTPLPPLELDDATSENKYDVTPSATPNPPPPLPIDSNENSGSKKSLASGSRFGRQSPHSRTSPPPFELVDTNDEKRDATLPAIPNSPPLPPIESSENSSSEGSPASGSRFGRQSPQSRTSLPPFELDDTNGESKGDATISAIPNSPPPPPPSDSNENSSSTKFPVSGSHFGWQIPRSGTPLPPFELDDTNNENKCGATVIKTPRPPGSWAVTPAPWPLPEESQTDSVPVDKQYADQNNGLVTPAASLSRAGSLPLQTPAPPGGWVTTPSRKSILKVRFDVELPESDISATENGNKPTTFLPGNLTASSGAESAILPSSKTHRNGDAAMPVPVNVEEKRFDVPSGTLLPRQTVPISPRSLRKSPSIRLVDAFGRERLPSEKDGNRNQKKADVSGNVDDVFRSGTTVRIVDAMGRDVADTTNGDASKPEDDHPLKHNEALARVRQGLADLANGFNEGDRSIDEPQLDRQLVIKLEDESRGARDIRKQLSQTLLAVQSAGDDRRSESKSLEANMKQGSILAKFVSDRRLPWNYVNGWSFWGFATLQILLAIIMYRISTARARDMFLTKYYDPFYADLHLYIAKPDALHYSFSSSHISTPWSILSILDTFRQEGWLAATVMLWNNILARVSMWQSHTWEAWGADSYGQEVSWPPT